MGGEGGETGGGSGSGARSSCSRGAPYSPGSEASPYSNVASSKYALMRSMSSPCRSLCQAMNDRIRARTWSNCAGVFGTWTAMGILFPRQVMRGTQTSNYNSTKLGFVYFGFHPAKSPGKKKSWFIFLARVAGATRSKLLDHVRRRLQPHFWPAKVVRNRRRQSISSPHGSRAIRGIVLMD